MKIEHATRHTRVCEALVPKPAIHEHSRSWSLRVAKAQRAGRDPRQCAIPSGYLVDGVPMCPRHAGQEALRFLSLNKSGKLDRTTQGDHE